MKYYMLKIIILNILLFKGTVVYCDVLFDPSQKKINTPNRQDDTELIKSSCSYIEIDALGQLTRRFVYEIGDAQSAKVSHPNKLDRINFNGYMIYFDENATLPNVNADHISIYTCIHNKPILIYMYVQSKRYYYSLDARTNKWNNYEIKFDKNLTRYTDENNTCYFTIDEDKPYATTDKFEYKEVVRRLCEGETCTKVNVIQHRDLEIYMKKNCISKATNAISSNPTQLVTSRNNDTNVSTMNITKLTVNIELFYTFYIDPLTRRFVYKMLDSHRGKLTYPYKLETIKFNDYMIKFDENAKLPNDEVSYISIYTCEHNNPILIYMYAESKYYFYSLTSVTNKWTNHLVKHDTRYAEYRDSNGVPYYTISDDDSYSTTDKFEDKELVKYRCKKERCANANPTNYNNIEVFLKNPDIPQVIKSQSPNTYQVPRVSISNKNTVSQPSTISHQNCVMSTRIYDYKVDDSLRDKFIFPNGLNLISFNDYMIQFDENAKLPMFYADYIHIYTCKHNIPILIYIRCISIYYFYRLDSKSNKWTNYRLNNDMGLAEFIDINGAYYYIVTRPQDYNSSPDEHRDQELVKKLCEAGKCVRINANVGRNVLVFLKKLSVPDDTNNKWDNKQQVTNRSSSENTPSRTNTTRSSIVNVPVSIPEPTPTKGFDYDIDISSTYRLRYPNRLDRINFNDYMIQFDDNAIMPDVNIYYFFIYTCKHNNPILMYMFGDSRFYYYSPNSKTKKWTNHLVKHDTRLIKHVDENGAYYYTVSLDDYPKSKSNTQNKFEDRELVKQVCNDSTCQYLDVSGDKNIQIYMKQSGTSPTIKYKTSNLQQQNKVGSVGQKMISKTNGQSRSGDDTGSNNGYEQDTYESDVY